MSKTHRYRHSVPEGYKIREGVYNRIFDKEGNPHRVSNTYRRYYFPTPYIRSIFSPPVGFFNKWKRIFFVKVTLSEEIEYIKFYYPWRPYAGRRHRSSENFSKRYFKKRFRKNNKKMISDKEYGSLLSYKDFLKEVKF